MKRLIRNYIRIAVKHPFLLILAGVVITAIGATGLRRLRLTTDFAKLLPENTPSVKAARNVGEAVGSTDFLVVAVESPDPANNIELINTLGPRLEKLPELGTVVWKLDTGFFSKNGLLYLDVEDLERLHEVLQRKVSMRTQEAVGLFVDLEDDFDDDNSDTDECRPPERDDLDLLIERYRNRGSPQSIGFYRSRPEGRSETPSGYMTTPDGKIAVLLAKPVQESLSLDFVKHMVRRAEAEIEQVVKEKNFENMRVELGGAYRNRVREYNAVIEDVKKSGLVSALLILLVVTLMFRRVRPIPLIFIPLTSGIIWTLGVFSITPMRELNIITAFIVGILLGLGIDFGVHLCARYLQERADGAHLQQALENTVFNTGRAILASAVTTAAALFLLAVSHFKGFSEFGIIAGGGVLICLASFFLWFPPLAAALEKLLKPKTWKPFLSLRKKARGEKGKFPLHAALVLAGALGFTLYCLTLAPELNFEYNFQRLSGRDTSTTIRYGDAIGDRASPSVALADDRESAKEFYELLKDRTSGDLGDPIIRDFMAVDMFIPERQDEKLKVLARIKKLLEEALEEAVSEERRKSIENAMEMTSLSTLTVDDLPSWVKDQFRLKSPSEGKEGELGRFVLVYPNISQWHAAEVLKYKEKYNHVTLPSGGEIFLASSSFVLSDVIRAVQSDTKKMGLLAAILVLLVLIADVRHPLKALLVFIPLATGLIWMVGVLVLIYERLSLYNMVVVSTIVGAGIDASVHLYHSYRESGPGSLREVFCRTGLAVTAAGLTTAVGFAGMMLSHHGGLASIGKLAMVGLCTCLLAALTVLPSTLALQEWFLARRSKKTADTKH